MISLLFYLFFLCFQDILSQSTVALHIEVHPRYLIPDTNCFVDDLISIKAIASAHPLYQLMIPITGKFYWVVATDGSSPAHYIVLRCCWKISKFESTSFIVTLSLLVFPRLLTRLRLKTFPCAPLKKEQPFGDYHHLYGPLNGL